ncbi:Cyclic nucleotide-binding protein [Pseudocohnilembus persalinus]|uniref:Cyclic nucleotide-binding protein n=1 Tax=Pseudocohnilembus persalinus TaxID=266149 RepID=A0A0V0QRH3_PSEPJ|nr:Cyclic nucleotide-binding protein [Pseudocohnilembus persalinus]|eukprot:KRX04883.1 Cyclic nucleotide-binding protein [Pseudocohnilembus persalinus]
MQELNKIQQFNKVKDLDDALKVDKKVIEEINDRIYKKFLFFTFFNYIVHLSQINHQEDQIQAEVEDSHITKLYILSIQFTNDASTGNSFGQVFPLTIPEIICSIIVMVGGASFFAILFASFESVIQLFRVSVEDLFNLGSPGFVFTINKYLYHKACVKNDIVIRAGEIADEFFIIKYGRVEVVATDGKTIIGILEEGSFFGEIGLLMNNQKRSVSIRAMQNCLFLCLNKEKFDLIMNIFPDQKGYLQRVSKQRLKTTDKKQALEKINLPEFTPFYDLSDSKLYTFYLYWAITCSSSGSYGEIYVVILFSEVSNLSTTYKTLFAQHLEKMDIIDFWCDIKKVPISLKSRIDQYYEYYWFKFRGIDEDVVLQDLPQTIQNEIIISIMSNIAFQIQQGTKGSGTGALLSILKFLKLQLVPKGEYVFLKQEIATEMYFIIEGKAQVIIQDQISGSETVVNVLKKGDYFGEIAILGKKPGIRGAGIKAQSNLFLASLSLGDFNLICNFYPEIYNMISNLGKEREKQNKARQQNQNSSDEKQLSSARKQQAIQLLSQASIIDQINEGQYD